MLAIIDYQMGNLRSVQKAFENVGYPACVTSDASAIEAADKIVLPGVGAFKDAISELKRRDLVPPLLAAIEAGKPVLGICLGLQLLFDVSEEDGQHEGLGVIPGRVVRFRPSEGSATPVGPDAGPTSAVSLGEETSQRDATTGPTLKVPHMGWNQLRIRRQVPLLAGIPDGSHFYFVHSYFVAPAADDVIATETDYGIPFCSMIRSDNLYATQFHPEKSQRIGLQMLKNFAQLGES